MDVLISKGRFQIGQGILLVIFSIGSFFLLRFLYLNTLGYQYLQIDRLLMAIACTLVLTYFLIFKGFEEYKAVDIYAGHLKIKWVFGLISIRLDKNKLSQFGLSSVKDSNYVYVKTDQFVLWFNESLTENNSELIDQLREWRITRKDNQPVHEFSKLEKKIGGFALMITGVFMFGGILLLTYINPRPTTGNDDLTAVSGHLSRSPDVKKPSLRSSSSDIYFELKD